MSQPENGQLFSRELSYNADETPSSSFSAQEVHELSRLNLHLTKAINGGSLPAQKLKLAKESLLKLQTRLKPINALFIEAPRDSDLHRFTVDIFHSLRELYLNRCPPSTVLGIYNLRFQLNRLEVINSGISSLFEFLGPEDWDRSYSCDPMLLPGDVVPIPDEYKWHQVTNLRLSNCGVDRLDKCMHLFPNLEQLDISFNDISHVIHLQDSPLLSVLNISNNRISVLSNLNRVISNIRRLNLSNNCIESLDGLGFLESLERLDVSCNLIDDFQEISHLAELTALESVVLEGNLLSLRSNYRLHVFSKFLDGTIITGRELPVLDGLAVTELESYAMRGIMFRPSYSSSGNQQRTASVGTIQPRSPSRLISVSARTPTTNLLADLMLNTPPQSGSRSSFGGDDAAPYSRERYSSVSGYDNKSTSDYRSISVVELDRRFNAALAVWTAALSSSEEGGARSPVVNDMLSPSKVFESNYVKGPQFNAAKPSSALKRAHTGGGQFEIRDRIMRMQSKFGEEDNHKGDIPALSPQGKVSPVGSDDISGAPILKHPPALKNGHLSYTPNSSPGNTPRSTSSRNVSFALPAPSPGTPTAASKRAINELSEKELLHLISLNHRNSINVSNPMKKKKRAKVAHVADEVLSRLPSLLSEYRVQVEQKSFVPKESPAKARSPKRELRSVLSPRGTSNGNTSTPTTDLSSPAASPKASVNSGWEVEKNERERRKSDIRGKLLRMQASLDTMSTDDNGDGAGDTTELQSPGPGEVEIDKQPALSDEAIDISSNSRDNGEAGAGEIETDANKDGDEVEPSNQTLAATGSTEVSESASSSTVDESGNKESFVFKDDTLNSKARSRQKVNPLVPKISSEVANPSPLSLLDWEDDEDTYDRTNEPVNSPRVVEAEAANVTVALDGEALRVSTVVEENGDMSDQAGSGDDQLEALEASDVVTFDKPSSLDNAGVMVGGGIRKMSSSSMDRRTSASSNSTSSEPGGGTMVIPSVSGEMSRHSIEVDLASSERINPPYVGNADYEQFGVIENLELYMREQIFSSNRPSFPAPYILSDQCDDASIEYVAPPPYTERFVAVYREKVYISSSACEGSKGSEYTSLRELSGDGVGSPQQTAKVSTGSGSVVSTPYILLVATDLFLYVLKDFPRINRATKSPYLFRDAPIPVLIRVHPLQCLRVCTIFFNFQRCALNFSSSSSTFSLPPALDNGYTYVVITREKSRTYPLITTLPPLANSVRSVADNSSRKVLIENTDAQLLDGVTDILRGLKSTLFDVTHYQMVFQYKKKHASVLYPRSLVVSQDFILLCDEDLTSCEAKINLIDSNRLNKIFQVRTEENPLHLTIMFKSKAVFGPGKKWRLIFETRTAASRTREECKRACAEIGNNDV